MPHRVRAPAAAAIAALLGLGIGLGAVPSAAETPSQPYAGEEARRIASLSEGDIAALLAGEGWGFAKAAELNGYPGPAHVLEHAEALRLDERQRERIDAIHAAMKARARDLGARYVAAEARLDDAFTGRAIDAATLAALTDEAAALRGELRHTHLAAHLETLPLLSRHQAMTYQRLRGYASSGGGGGGGHAH